MKLNRENQAVSVNHYKDTATIQFSYEVDPTYTNSYCYGNKCEKSHYVQGLYYDFLMTKAVVKYAQLIDDCNELKLDEEREHLFDEKGNKIKYINVEVKIRFQNHDSSYLVDTESKFSLYACTCFSQECNDKLD